MQNTYELYKRVGYWYLLLIPLIFFGFYRTYFSVLFAPTDLVVHLHFASMIVWAAMLIIQPFLIRYKKLKLHRTIGRISYVVVPLLLITGYFMIRFAYYRVLGLTYVHGAGDALPGKEELQTAADAVRITVLYFFWLAFFYFSAIRNRGTASVHAKYMVAASLTMIGPTVDRIVGIYFQIEYFFGIIPVESLSYLLQDLIIGGLLIYDYQNRRPTKTLWTCLLVYISGQVLYYFVKGKAFWEAFVSFVV